LTGGEVRSCLSCGGKKKTQIWEKQKHKKLIDHARRRKEGGKKRFLLRHKKRGPHLVLAGKKGIGNLSK